MARFIRLPSALKERILLRELNRRINNELASAIASVSAGAVLADNQDVKTALSGVVEFLHKYVDVHSALAIPVSDMLVDAAEYLRRLRRAMTRSTLDRMQIRLLFVVDALPLEADRCWQLGLIVHELVTNAARHAHLEKGDGEIRVELRRSGGSVSCDVSDNGSVSTAAGRDDQRWIAGNLATMLGGRIERDLGAGSQLLHVTFPLTGREQRANGALTWRRSGARHSAVSPLADTSSELAYVGGMRAS